MAGRSLRGRITIALAFGTALAVTAPAAAACRGYDIQAADHRQLCNRTSDPADDAVCTSTAGATMQGRLRLDQEIRSGPSGAPTAGRACGFAWVVFPVDTGGRADAEVTIDVVVDEAKAARETAAVARPGDRGTAEIILWAATQAPPDIAQGDECSPQDPFRRVLLDQERIVALDRPTSEAVASKPYELQVTLANADRQRRVQLYVGVLGDTVHSGSGFTRQSIQASVPELACDVPILESVSPNVEPRTITPAAAPPAPLAPPGLLASAEDAAATTAPREPVAGGGPEEATTAEADTSKAPARPGQLLETAELAAQEGGDGWPFGPGIAALLLVLCAGVFGVMRTGADPVRLRRLLTRVRLRGARVADGGAAAAPRVGLVQRIGKAGTALTAVLGLISSLAVVVFLVRPNLEPETANRVSISDVTVETGVTLGEYEQHPMIARALAEEEGPTLSEANPTLVDAPGVVVHFSFESAGYTSSRVVTRWTVFDAESRGRIEDSEGRDPLPYSFRAERRDADIGSWETWIQASGKEGRNVFVRMELFDPSKGLRLAFRDSPPFVVPST